MAETLETQEQFSVSFFAAQNMLAIAAATRAPSPMVMVHSELSNSIPGAKQA
jgi:hypothetical protein